MTMEEKHKRYNVEGFFSEIDTKLTDYVDEKYDGLIKQDIESMNGRRRYKIPLTSRFFGSKIEQKNYKLIPLKVGVIEIKIKKNPYAFYYDFKNNGNSVPTKGEKLKWSLDISKEEVKPSIMFDEYRFDDNTEADMNSKYSGGMVIFN